MSARSDISPETLSVSLTADGIEVEYSDGRSVFYRGVPRRAEGSVRTPPGKDVHVLVTDASETQGVLTYVNDLKTHDDILESTGVGRVLLDLDEETSVFPGVTVRNKQHRVRVEMDPETTEGRVFVFAEDEMGEQSWEIVPGEGDD